MLTTFLMNIKDFRRPQAQKYKLHDVILFSIIAILCNAKSYRDIHRFIKVHFEDLTKDFSLLWVRPPAYTTIRNIIKGIDTLELEAAFRAYTQSLVNYYKNDEQWVQIAIDGKTLCKSFDHFNDKKALQKLMFFDVNEKLILGHIPISDKTNEIPAVQSLLEKLELTNQKLLLQDVESLSQSLSPCDTYVAKAEAGHGRIAKRTTKVYHQQIGEFILDEQWAAHLKTLVCVSRTYDIFNTKARCYEQRSETAWYVCNGKITAQSAAGYVLKHWGIENSNHYVRDVSLAEDDARIRNNSANMAILRSTAINILRKQKITNIKGELYLNSLCWKQLYTYPHLI